MAISAKIIEDSINPINGIRLTTFQLKYPRFIHAEVLTHRMFSRNASSSRAIPVSTMLKQIWDEPAAPVHWGENEPGMQSKKELIGVKKLITKLVWKYSGRLMCVIVWLLNKISSPHKQLINRMTEPWQEISVVLTATDWDNWFE